MRFFTCLTDDHNLWLVGLAAALCLIGSVITFRLFRRLRAAETGTRLAWSFMGAVATGATIWCTHFVAMIAYEPGATVSYEPLLTGLSLGVAMLGSGAALWVASRAMRGSAELGGVLFGLTVVAMHYTGMAGFATDAIIHWSATYVAASVAGAVVFGGLAFHLARRPGKAAPVVLMVLGIVTLHFTGMAAMTVIPLAPLTDASVADSANVVLAFAVSAVGLMMLGTGIATYALDMQFRIQAKARLEHLLEGSVDGMVVEQDGLILAANAAFADLVGVDHGALVGEPLSRWMADTAHLHVGCLTQSRLIGPAGAEIPVEIAARRDGGRAVESDIMIYAVRDLRTRLAQERRIAHLARNDGLTGLPNRSSFLEWLTRQTSDPVAATKVALLAMDLDRFKEVNDVHGHAAGDQLLIQVAERMRAALRPGEFVARLGGDEFVAVVPVQRREDALDLAERLRAAVTAPVMLDHAEVSCGLSVGIAVWPDDADNASALINDADLAMYRAKASLGTDVCFYEEEMDEAVRSRRRMAQQMREALDQGQFSLNWQIQAAVETGAITGYEVLLRWIQPDGTFISPADFIPLAEGKRPDPADRGVGFAHRLRRGGPLARAAQDRRQPVAGPTGPCRPAAPGASGSDRDGSRALAAGAGDHRNGHDHRHGAHDPRPAPAEAAGRLHRHGRLRHRLFVAVDPARLPVRQDQAGPLLHVRTGRRAGIRRHHPRRPGPGRKPAHPGPGRGGGDAGSAQFPARPGLRRGAGLSVGTAAKDGRRRNPGRRPRAVGHRAGACRHGGLTT